MMILSMSNVNAQDILLQRCSVRNDTIMSENYEGAEEEVVVEGEEGEEEEEEVEKSLVE